MFRRLQCIATSVDLEMTKSPLVRSRFEMRYLHALYTIAVVLIASNSIRCDDKAGWYTGLRNVLKNCPSESLNNSGQDEFLEKFRRCIQQRALITLDSLLADDIIPVFEGLDLVRFQDDRANSTENYGSEDSDEGSNWTTIILSRLIRVLRTHVFKVDIDNLTTGINVPANSSGVEVDNNIFEGRRRRHRRRHHHMMPLMMMGLLLMGSILIPMGFQFLAVLGGKALILAKMALILSSIQGLKKIATNGVNYGLYHTPVAEGWHERSNQETPSNFDLPYPPYPQSRP